MLVVNRTLVIIDIQNDYFPGGRMELHESIAATEQAAQVLAYFRTADWPIVHVRHVATEADATFFLPDTAGAEIHPLVAPAPDERVITKHSPNAFLDTDLKAQLDKLGASELVIVGMMTHMCVDSTTRAASDAGLDCVVVGDACATRAQHFAGVDVDAPSVQAAFLSALSGTFATVTTTEKLIATLANAVPSN